MFMLHCAGVKREPGSVWQRMARGPFRRPTLKLQDNLRSPNSYPCPHPCRGRHRGTRRRGGLGMPAGRTRGERGSPDVANFAIVRCGLLNGFAAAKRFAAAGVMGLRFALAAAISLEAILPAIALLL